MDALTAALLPFLMFGAVAVIGAWLVNTVERWKAQRGYVRITDEVVWPHTIDGWLDAAQTPRWN